MKWVKEKKSVPPRPLPKTAKIPRIGMGARFRPVARFLPICGQILPLDSPLTCTDPSYNLFCPPPPLSFSLSSPPPPCHYYYYLFLERRRAPAPALPANEIDRLFAPPPPPPPSPGHVARPRRQRGRRRRSFAPTRGG